MTEPQLNPPPWAPPQDPSASLQTDGREWLRHLDWRQFEALVGTAYRLQGFTVLPTSPGADGGIDLILTRDNERIFVQCKHWKAWQVGAPVIRELFGLVSAHRATRGIVVTSGTFSREAREFAAHTGTRTVGRSGCAVPWWPAGIPACRSATRRLPWRAMPLRPTMSVPPMPPVGSLPGSPVCPVCLSAMVLQKARRGAARRVDLLGMQPLPGLPGHARGTARHSASGRRPGSCASRQRDQRTAIVALVAVIVGTAHAGDGGLGPSFGAVSVRPRARRSGSSRPPPRQAPPGPAPPTSREWASSRWTSWWTPPANCSTPPTT